MDDKNQPVEKICQEQQDKKVCLIDENINSIAILLNFFLSDEFAKS
jgi:hypothetical protein